jgi:hypothetical protein
LNTETANSRFVGILSSERQREQTSGSTGSVRAADRRQFGTTGRNQFYHPADGLDFSLFRSFRSAPRRLEYRLQAAS